MNLKRKIPHGLVVTIKLPCPSLHKHEKAWFISVHVTNDGPVPHGFGSRLQIPLNNFSQKINKKKKMFFFYDKVDHVLLNYLDMYK